MFARRFEREVDALQMPQDLIGGLWALVNMLNRDEYKTVDALLVAVAGNHAGGVMLHWLLKWLPKAGRADGAVYKSAVDWQAYVGLTRHQVVRINKMVLPQCGFTVIVKKANGSPTYHYYFDRWAFLQRVGAVLRLPASYVLAKMQKAANGFTGKRQMDLPESGKSLTESTTGNTTEKQDGGASPTVLRLLEIGVMRSIAETLADKPLDAVESILKQAYRLKSEGALRSLQGFVVSKLREWQHPLALTPPTSPLPMPLPPVRASQGYGERGLIAVHSEGEGDNSPRERVGNLRRLVVKVEPEPEPVNEKLQVLVNGTITAQEVWSAAYQQLELQFDKPTFGMWLSAARLVDCVDGTLIVSVRSAMARDFCQHSRLIARVLKDVAGVEVVVRFEADEAQAASSGGLRRFLAMGVKS